MSTHTILQTLSASERRRYRHQVIADGLKRYNEAKLQTDEQERLWKEQQTKPKPIVYADKPKKAFRVPKLKLDTWQYFLLVTAMFAFCCLLLEAFK